MCVWGGGGVYSLNENLQRRVCFFIAGNLCPKTPRFQRTLTYKVRALPYSRNSRKPPTLLISRKRFYTPTLRWSYGKQIRIEGKTSTTLMAGICYIDDLAFCLKAATAFLLFSAGKFGWRFFLFIFHQHTQPTEAWCPYMLSAHKKNKCSICT